MYPDDINRSYIYPAWAPTSIDGTASLSKSPCYPGETITVSGNAKFWNSTALPKNLDPTMSSRIDCEGCFVNVTINGAVYPTKCGANGDFSVQMMAPTAPGTYPVSIDVTNGSANRNVPTDIADLSLQVLQPGVNVTLSLTPSTALPSKNITANGTVRLDNGTIPAGAQVNVSIVETGDYWLTSVAPSGVYSTRILSPGATGAYHVNVSVRHPSYNVRGYNEKVLTVVAVPVPDIVVEAADVSLQGHYIQGKTVSINVTVRNKGIADANGTRVDVLLDGAILSSARFNVPQGGSSVSRVTWNATPGTHNISVAADPANEIAESSEINNRAWKNIVVLADADEDGIPNDTDEDDDNDGYPDAWEAFLGTDSLDSASIPLDTDGDGAPDGNAANTAPWMDADDDDDGVSDAGDAFPLDRRETKDTDGDGIGDNADPDADADGYLNREDRFPLDTDNDGLPNWLDLDDDGDGIRDSLDAMPLDTDNDGQRNDVDADDDGDGVPDKAEDANWNGRVDPGETASLEPDSDGDGTPDGQDPYPIGQAEEPDSGVEATPGLLVTLLVMMLAPVVLLVMLLVGGKPR